ANVWQLLGLPGLIAMGALWWQSRRLAQKREGSLAQALADSEALIEQLRQDLAHERARADRYDPHNWLGAAEQERRDHNEAKAVAGLRAAALHSAPALHRVYLELARHHVALYPDHGELTQLCEAQRLARIANQLRPDDSAASGLLEEIDGVMAMLGSPQRP